MNSTLGLCGFIPMFLTPRGRLRPVVSFVSALGKLWKMLQLEEAHFFHQPFLESKLALPHNIHYQ